MTRSNLAFAFFLSLASSLLIVFTPLVQACEKIAWEIDVKQSQLTVLLIADGIPFESYFSQMQGNIIFDKNNLADSFIEVSVPIDSLRTGNSDGDELARSAAFLNLSLWPTAHFRSNRISLINSRGLESDPLLKDKQRLKGELYQVSGELRLKNITQKLSAIIKFISNEQTAVLSGKSSIQRLDFAIGTGEWRNTKWISNSVAVAFSLSLKRKTIQLPCLPAR